MYLQQISIYLKEYNLLIEQKFTEDEEFLRKFEITNQSNHVAALLLFFHFLEMNPAIIQE